MSRFLSVLRRLSAVGFDQAGKRSIFHAQKVLLTNRFAILIALITFVYGLILYKMNSPTYGAEEFACSLIIVPVTFGLNHQGFANFARIFLLIGVCVSVLISNASFDYRLGVELYYLPIGIAAILAFETHEYFRLTLAALFPIFFWQYPNFSALPVLPDAYVLRGEPLHWVQNLNAIAVYLTTLLIAWLFISAKARFERDLIASSKFISLGEMAAGVAHEINDPLAMILSKIELLKMILKSKRYAPEKLDLEIVKIEETATQIASIIRGLLNFSRNSGDLEPSVAISVKKMIDDTLALCQSRLLKAGIEFRINFKYKGEVFCHPEKLMQVLLTLVSNSIDALNGKEKSWIEMSVQEEQVKWIEIGFTDSGSGIPLENRDKIMQPFFTTKESGKGIGLGLSICKGIIEEMGGRFALDAKSAHTRFIIHLPRS